MYYIAVAVSFQWTAQAGIDYEQMAAALVEREGSRVDSDDIGAAIKIAAQWGLSAPFAR